MKAIYKQGDTRFILQLKEDSFALVDIDQEQVWYSEYAETWLRAGYWEAVTEQPNETVIKQLEAILV